MMTTLASIRAVGVKSPRSLIMHFVAAAAAEGVGERNLPPLPTGAGGGGGTHLIVALDGCYVR